MDAILAVSAITGRHLQQAGLLVCGLGAIALIVAGAFGLRSLSGGGSRREERLLMVVAGLLLGIGFLLQVIGVHYR